MIDFHALRTTFVTNLARSGAHPRVAQALARHSDVKLTMDVYTHVDLEDQVRAVEALPDASGAAFICDDSGTRDLSPSLSSEGDQACGSVTSDGLEPDAPSSSSTPVAIASGDAEQAENAVLNAADAHPASGAPARTRTWDRRIRNPMLYPPELRAPEEESSTGAGQGSNGESHYPGALPMPDEPRPERKRLYLPEDLALRPATRADYPFLYALLVERYEKETANIPGRAREELPSYGEHVAHLERAPYPRLEIVAVEDVDAGMLYVNRRNVGGCFIRKELAGRGVGAAACYVFYGSCELPLVVEIHPRNRSAWRTAERLGFVRVGETRDVLTFELRQPPRDPFRHLRGRTSA